MKSDELLEQFVATRRSLGRTISPYLQEMAIGPKQLVVLRTIGKRGECSMSTVAEATASDMASVTRMVTSLVSSGWLEKQRDEGDRRQWIVRLTTKGLSQWDTINAVVHEIAVAFAANLDEAEKDELIRLLNKVQQGLDDATALQCANQNSTAPKTQE